MSNTLGTRLSQAVTSFVELFAFAPPPVPVSSAADGQTAAIFALSEDVLLLVFALLDADDLLACKEVCRALARLIQSDVSSQYRIELATSGMVDRPQKGVALTERLQQLREYRSRSLSAAFSCDAHLSSTTAARVQVLVSDGTTLYAARQPAGYKLDVRSPPSIRNPAATSSEPHHLSVALGQSEAHIEAMDVSQDLLIASEGNNDTWEVKVHLLSLVSGNPHACAADPFITTVSEQGRPFLTQVYRQYVAWLVWLPNTSDRKVEIWDWRTGRLVWQHSFRPQTSFAFLDASHLVVTSGRQEELYVYCFDSLEDESHTPASPPTEPLLTLELPIGAFRCSIHHDERSRLHSSSPPPNTPFCHDPMLAVLAVRFAIYAPDLSMAILLVPGATFREQIDLAHADKPSTRRVFWHNWGPQGGLLLNMTSSEVIPRVVSSPYGSRFPVLIRDKRKKDSAHVVIFDLNPWAARRASLRSEEGRLAPIKDVATFRFRALRATVPHVAYQGPRISFPKDHKPTFVTMNYDGLTVLHEWKPPYQERLGFGYQTFYT